ncbi:hypothetical protein [Caballeronia sp. GAFFF1]|uniref:hypothetical protein n=1 Tax=Caballeronia sp. GAFFF1 TaxID=2921779 RepID=UPI002027729F|nr:hypothetical protein [Caballeronia sp. GAFFF1]
MSKPHRHQEGTRTANEAYPDGPEKDKSSSSPDNAGKPTPAGDENAKRLYYRPLEFPRNDAASEGAEGPDHDSAHEAQASAGNDVGISPDHRDEKHAGPSPRPAPERRPHHTERVTEASPVEVSTSGNKNDGRVEPQNIAEFIDTFVGGKAKTLSSATAKRLMGASTAIEPAVRGQLLRRVQETDPTLERTRKLMLLARENRTYKTLTQELLEFCVECVLLNSAVRATGMKAMLFPGFGDESSLEEAWHRLQSLSVPERPETLQTAQSETASERKEPAGSSIRTDDRSGGQRGPKDSKDRTPGGKAAASRSRRNALLCSAIWRMHHGQTTFAETMRSLRTTVFALRERPQSLEAEVFEAIATLPEREDERVAYVLEWSVRQQAEALNRLAGETRKAEALQSRVTATEEQLRVALERAEMLGRQLEAERTARAAADRAVGVAQTHGQADLEEVRAMSLRAIRDAIAQLDVVSAALNREFPKIDSARDKVDAVMDALKNTNNKLEEA